MNRYTLLFWIISMAAVHSGRAQPLTPEAFLGYELGSAFTPHMRVEAYVRHIVEHTDHMQLVSYGHTVEGRSLHYVIASAPEHMARLEELRLAHLRSTGLIPGVAEASSPAIVWLSYNVHGNESVGTEAAMAVLYELANPANDQVQAWLRDAVVVVDPCLNPDGRERYVQFYRRTRGAQPNIRPEAREHFEPWPGGRTNHYYFDLNRDWVWGTQTETRQRLPHYNRWMPHVHVDFHEQSVNAPYFFAPAAEPLHERITPWQRELQGLMGANHARYFDANGWLYFTRQVFDLFYPGYGDTWPTFNGALGMTYEQGGSGRAGLGILTAEGDTLTLSDRIEHHYTTSLSTIEVAARNRERITSEFAAYFAQSPAGPYAAYVIRSAGQADEVRTLTGHLDLIGISYGWAESDSHTRGLAYASGEVGPVHISEGDLVVSASQPKAVLTHVLFEPEPTLSDSLSYDITAWALPYVYDLEAYAVADPVPFNPIAPVPTRPDLPDRPAVYLAEWTSFEDARMLASLLKSGVRVRFNELPFTIEDRAFGPGTLIMTRGGAGADFDHTLREIADRHSQPLYALTSTLVSDGVDFGSGDVPFLDPPRIAVVAGPAASAYSLGELWHFFDQQLEYPVTLVESNAFSSLHLFNYDVILLPGGGYGDVLTESGLADLLDWVRAGGRLIALEAAARSLAGKDGFGLTEREDSDSTDQQINRLRVYAERDRDAITEEVTGAVFRAQLDSTHPLAFGYDADYFTLKRSSTAHEWLEDGWNVGVLREAGRVSGFAGSVAASKLDNSLLFGTEPMGRGEVIYLLDNPIFRGFWYGGRLLLANAVFLTGQRSLPAY